MKTNVLIFNITDKCNSRCIMCGVWNKKKIKEVSVQELEEFFLANKEILEGVSTVGLVGGEPFLNKDYTKIIKLLVDNLPNLKSIGTPTNGLLPDLVTKNIEESLRLIPKDIFFGISVSVDGLGKRQDEIRNIKGSFEKCNELIDKANKDFFEYDNFYITLTSTICRQNTSQMDDLLGFAKEKDKRITLRPAMVVESDYIDNKTNNSAWRLRKEEYYELSAKFKELYHGTLNEYYLMISRMFNGETRDYCCPFQDEGLIINSDLNVYMCLFSDKGYLGNLKETDFDLSPLIGNATYTNARTRLLNNACPGCFAECFTSRSSRISRNAVLKEVLNDLINRRYNKANQLISKFEKHPIKSFLRKLLDFCKNNKKPEETAYTFLEKIFYNCLYGNKQLITLGKNGAIKRNEVSLSYNYCKQKDDIIKNTFLNIAKYYYIIKSYREGMIYLEVLEQNFDLEDAIKEEIILLKNRMKLDF